MAALYAPVRLADHTLVGAPGPLPYCVANWHDTEVADLDVMGLDPVFGLAGKGFWPVVITTPVFDPATQALAGTATLSAPDPATRTVPATANVRALTADEIGTAVAAAREVKLAELSAACAAEILGGYSSAALGAPHTYPSNPNDQSNMNASVTASLLPGQAADWTALFMCEDADGLWAMRPHTAAQIQQAGHDGYTAILQPRVKLDGLKAQVAAATTAAQVNALSW